MLDNDHSTAQALRALSARDDDPAGLDRRRFLQAVAMGGIGSLAVAGGHAGRAAAGPRPASPLSRLALMPAAAPIDDHDGILVSIVMYGGNDGMNTLVPYGDGNYYAMRGGLAIPQNQVLAIDGHVGLHPNLGFLKSMYDAGQVAIVQGVGYNPPDLSHFSSMAIWMSGRPVGGTQSSGWLGRWIDGLDGDPFRAATIGTSVPLHMIGELRRAIGVPDYGGAFGTETDATDLVMYEGLRAYSAAGAGRGAWHDAVAATVRAQLDVTQTVEPLFGAALPDENQEIARKLVLAARLINADLGMRVVDVGWGDFDSHDGQLTMHTSRMAELNAGLEQFFTALDDRFRTRVTVLITSEFGRSPYANDSGGTDHGTASCTFVLGAAVRGGLYGQYPSLSGLRRWDELTNTVDFRSVYATILDQWLGGGASSILGGNYEQLPLFAAGPGFDLLDIPAPPALDGDYIALQPTRVLDTRNGIGGRRTPLGSGTTVEFQAMGAAGVPTSGVTAVAVNITATEPSATSYLTVWPAREARPNASSLNFTAGKTVPNLVVMKPGKGGRISVWNESGNVHVIGDIVGYFRESGADRMLPLQPFRLLDTRNGIGVPAGRLGEGGTIPLQVTGVPGSGVPSGGVDAVILNVTVDQPTKWSYLTIWPHGQPLPNASSLNFDSGQTVANLVIAKVGDGGLVDIFNSFGSTEVIADVVGCFTSENYGRHHPVGPERLLDTRNGIGAAAGRIGQQTFRLQVAGRAGVPANATAAVLNMTVTEPDSTSFLTVWPGDQGMPNASTLNYRPGLTVANLAIAKLGADGTVNCANAFGSTHLIADVVGYFTAP